MLSCFGVEVNAVQKRALMGAKSALAFDCSKLKRQDQVHSSIVQSSFVIFNAAARHFCGVCGKIEREKLVVSLNRVLHDLKHVVRSRLRVFLWLRKARSERH